MLNFFYFWFYFLKLWNLKTWQIIALSIILMKSKTMVIWMHISIVQTRQVLIWILHCRDERSTLYIYHYDTSIKNTRVPCFAHIQNTKTWSCGVSKTNSYMVNNIYQQYKIFPEIEIWRSIQNSLCSHIYFTEGIRLLSSVLFPELSLPLTRFVAVDTHGVVDVTINVE